MANQNEKNGKNVASAAGSKVQKPAAPQPKPSKNKTRPIGITETGLRDAHQSIMATRLRT